MNELWNGMPSIRPFTLTSPRVPKNSTDFGQITQTHAPVFGVRQSFALNETASGFGFGFGFFLEALFVARRAPTFFRAAMVPSRTKRGSVEAGHFFVRIERPLQRAVF